mmetsp:Transcript_43470/g.80905  ORF Transcript_43470/g.80905 Transcript_43470/m.80905 type:complete len:244 (+) Transcript_43470:1116-1847(+)
MRLVRDESQHDEIGILPVHAMPRVWLISRLIPHVPDVLHDFVLALPRNLMPRKNDFEPAPVRVFLDLLPDEVFDGGRDARHELCAGSDAVGVERAGVRRSAPTVVSRRDNHFVFGRLREVFRAAEPTGSLLIQLCAGCNAIDGHEHRHLGFNYLRDDAIEIVHDPEHHILLAEDIGHIHVGGMRTSVNDTVHVQVQVVELGKEGRVRDYLVDLRIAFADPSVKLGDTHLVKILCQWLESYVAQ